MDITLESDSTFVLIENKITSTAKRNGQLLGYHQAAVRTCPDKPIVALYLAPTRAMGLSEVALVKASDEYFPISVVA